MLIPIIAVVVLVLGGAAIAIRMSRSRLKNKVLFFWNTRHNSDLYSSEAIGITLLAFWRGWCKHFPGDDKKVFKILNSLDLEFRDKTWDAAGEGKILGDMVGKQRVRLWRGPRFQDGFKLSRTPLIHQLINVMLLHLKGDPYYGREGRKYSEWIKPYNALLKEVQEELRNKGF